MAEWLLDRALRHVMPFVDYGQDTDLDRYHLVMPLADSNLGEHVERHGPLPEDETVPVLSWR